MPDNINTLTEGLGKTLETVPELYEDAFQPATKETGKLIALIPRAINAAFSGLEKWILNKEYNVEETKKILAQKLENVEPEKIVEPEAYVAVPAIQAISYAMNSEELRNLYANLLAKAMNSDEKDKVHPGYIETIKQLSPADATYFKHIHSLRTRPLVDVSLRSPKNSSLILAQNCNSFSSDYNNVLLIIDNLVRLGLINIPENSWYSNASLYDPLIKNLEKAFPLESYKIFHPDASKIAFSKKRIDITSYGENFYKTCVI